MNSPADPAPVPISQSAAAPSPRRQWLVAVTTIVIVIVAVAGTLWLNSERELLDRIVRSPWALPALFVASLISNATLIMPIPGLGLTALVGSLLNPMAVGIVAGIGQTLGEMTGYMAGYSGQGLVNKTSTYERVEGWMKRNTRMTVWVVFALALIPNPVFDVAGMAAGALRFPVWKYLLAAGAGKVVKNILVAYAGNLGIDWLLRIFGG